MHILNTLIRNVPMSRFCKKKTILENKFLSTEMQNIDTIFASSKK